MAYDYKNGAFISKVDSYLNESIFDMETIYYLQYNSKKGLYALDKLLKNSKEDNIIKKCDYYHIFLDLLFEATGQIIDRFRGPKEKEKNKYIELDKQKEKIISIFEFNKKNFPLLNDKNIRNFIEHINEKDCLMIQTNQYYGTFNIIYRNMDIKVKKDLLDKKKIKNNIYNLNTKKYTIIFLNSKNIIEKKEVNLKDLKKEIERIYNISSDIWKYFDKNNL